MGIVFNIQRYSLHDGPGIRTTVFLKGCPLRCPWCHNPESQSPQPEVMFFESRCVRCGACAKVCPAAVAGVQGRANGAAGQATTPEAGGVSSTTLPLRGTVFDTTVTEVGSKHTHSTRAGACTACGLCVRACAYGAREMAGRSMGVEEVVSEVLRDRVFYDQSGGGVTFSGGEPLMQPEFLRGLLLRCREEGLRTTVDTCGFAPWEQLRTIAPLVDVFLYDVKLMDDARHRRCVGASNQVILDNLRMLEPLASSLGKTMVARIPLIPGINDDDANTQSTGEFLLECGVRRVNILPYHHLGQEKYRRLGREYGMPGAAPPPEDVVDRVQATLAGYGLSVKVGG